MNAKLLERSISERMFTREVGVVGDLLSDSSTSIRVIERHLVELTDCWRTLQKNHDAYVVEFIAEPVGISANDALIEKYLFEFIRLEAACDKFISTNTNTEPAVNTATPISNSIKLERVKFRTFDGDLRAYPKFKSEFKTFVEPLCQPKQLPFVLKSYLCESVKRQVYHIDHDVAAMWERLDEKYGSLQKQIDCVLNDFKNLPVCSDNDSTLNMIAIVENAEADLKCMNAADQLLNPLTISYIENSMSAEILLAWAKEIANKKDCHTSDAKFPMLLEFLKEWRWLIEYNDDDIRKSPNSQSHSTVVSKSARKCLIHSDDDHPVWRCRVFNAMTLSERKRIIESNNACTHCLERGHSSANCKRTFRCTAPGCHSSSHNVLLHDPMSN